MELSFKGPAKRIEDIDLPRIAGAIGCGEDELHMLMDVEAPGSGFDKQGRPKMLFEPHLFYRYLPTKLRDDAVRAGLAYSAWRKGSYPADSYPRLKKAMAFCLEHGANVEIALKSASWGRSQILGSNFAAAGYASAAAMVHDFTLDEDNHLEAMIRFIKASGIDDELRALAALKRPTRPEDCRVIARVYNGPGYATHNYHGRLASAHNWWRAKPDTPWTPEVLERETAAQAAAAPRPVPGTAAAPEPAQRPPMPAARPLETFMPAGAVETAAGHRSRSRLEGIMNSKVMQLVLTTAATAAAAAMDKRRSGDPDGFDMGDLLGAAIGAAMSSPGVVELADDTAKAVDSLPAAKPWWQSKGVLGAAGTVLVSAAALIGLQLTPDQAAEVIAHGTAIVTAVTGLIALYGRITAKKPVTA